MEVKSIDVQIAGNMILRQNGALLKVSRSVVSNKARRLQRMAWLLKTYAMRDS
jgi:hypothetical protein